MKIGILGLGVMGRSLAQNFERNGYSVAGYDLNLQFDRSLFRDKNYMPAKSRRMHRDLPCCDPLPRNMVFISISPILHEYGAQDALSAPRY